MTDPECSHCGEEYSINRWQLGYRVCKECGERRATEVRSHWTIAPMPKSNYILVTDLSLLKGLNSSHKGGLT